MHLKKGVEKTLYAINADGTLRWRREIYCRQADHPTSAAKTANIAGLNSTLQSGTKPIIANSKDP